MESKTMKATLKDLQKLKRAKTAPTGRAKFHANVDPLTGMNKTETKHATTLEAGRLAGQILGWRFEPMKLRLGNSWTTSYTPDFAVFKIDGTIELQDVKGGAGWTDDARVKIKVAARLYPEFVFVGITYKRNSAEREVIS